MKKSKGKLFKSRIAVLVEVKDNGVYPVDLNKDEREYVINLITQMHNGTIKVIDKKYEDIRFLDGDK